MFGAGVDTGKYYSMWFFVYCAKFSSEMKKAQKEVDDFVDKNRRLPKYV